MRIAFIINPIAGRATPQRTARVIERKLARHPEVSGTLYFTKSGEDTVAAARRFVDLKYNTIVAVGGDGTVNQVGSVVAACGEGAQVALGIIPAGSGNGLARHLRISMDLNRAVEQLLTGGRMRIDACTLNGRYFFCTAGLGFDAHVSHLFNASAGRGLWRYVQLVLTEYNTYRSLTLNLEVDGVPYSREAFLLTVANAAQWGNNFYIAPKASVTDGLLHTVICTRPALIEVPILAGEFRDRVVDRNRHVEIIPGRSISIVLDEPTWFHYDGESLQLSQKAEIAVCEKALWVQVPLRTVTSGA